MNIMKPAKPVLIALAAFSLISSSCAGRVDRVENRVDRTEDRIDRRVYSGPGDARENYWDKRENVNDKFRGRRALLY